MDLLFVRKEWCSIDFLSVQVGRLVLGSRQCHEKIGTLENRELVLEVRFASDAVVGIASAGEKASSMTTPGTSAIKVGRTSCASGSRASNAFSAAARDTTECIPTNDEVPERDQLKVIENARDRAGAGIRQVDLDVSPVLVPIYGSVVARQVLLRAHGGIDDSAIVGSGKVLSLINVPSVPGGQVVR